MPRSELDDQFSQIDELIAEINGNVPSSNFQAIKFRADLAGLLVVAIAATYENCVKNVMCNFASRNHALFGEYAQRNYEKLSSRIRINDLNKYCKLFSPAIHIRFKDGLSKRKVGIRNRVGKDIEKSYEQILDWRHSFAHGGIRETTIEEATATHLVGKRVLYAFDVAFNPPP